jgi:DNA invertase Pin-like site-specific DNA recombinase
MADPMARKFECLLVWKQDRFGRSLVDNIRTLEDHGIQFIAVTQNLDTDQRQPASKFLLHVLGAAAEFEWSPIRERIQAVRLRYRQDFESGKWARPCIAARVATSHPIGQRRFLTGKRCNGFGTKVGLTDKLHRP